jgi:SlyX protein
MENPKKIEDRVIDIEIRLTYQESMLQELNNVVIDQQKTIDRLRHELATLGQQMRIIEPSNIALMSEETPPPHY